MRLRVECVTRRRAEGASGGAVETVQFCEPGGASELILFLDGPDHLLFAVGAVYEMTLTPCVTTNSDSAL